MPPKKSKRCEHVTSRFTFHTVEGIERTFARHCLECESPLPLGAANDEPAEVQVEIRAAALAMTSKPGAWSEDIRWSELVGWDAHADSDDTPVDLGGLLAPGWLAREIATHDARTVRDADGYEWDTTRPIADQPAVVAFDVHAGDEPELGVEVEQPNAVPLLDIDGRTIGSAVPLVDGTVVVSITDADAIVRLQADLACGRAAVSVGHAVASELDASPDTAPVLRDAQIVGGAM